MPLAGEVVAEEHLAGVESPRLAVAGDHFALTGQDDADVRLGGVVGGRLRPGGERDYAHGCDRPEIAHLPHGVRRRAHGKLTVRYVLDAEARFTPFVRVDHGESHGCDPLGAAWLEFLERCQNSA